MISSFAAQLLSASILLSAAVATAQVAPQWSVQEITLQSSNTYENPYRETSVEAEFSGPQGSRQLVRGFWDGGQTFRIRWTPIAQGVWTYKTRSADPGLNGRTGQFRVTPPARGSHGFLRRDVEFPYSFIYDDGTRYFMFGNTYYGLVANALADGHWRHAVDNTRARKMNKIRFSLYRNLGANVMPAGPEPAAFEQDPDRINVAPFQKADEVVRYLAEKEIVADLIAIQRAQADRMSLEQAQRFLRYAIARYGAFPNVIWCLINEWQYSKKPKEFWSALGKLASQEDPWARNGQYVRGLSVHQQTRYDWEFFGENWYSHAIVQFGVRNRGKIHRGGDEWNQAGRNLREVFRKGDDWGYFSIAYNWGRNVPVVNDEYGYIGEPADETEPLTPEGQKQPYSRDKHRRTMWAIYTAGGYASAGDKTSFADGRPYFSANWHDEPEWDDVQHLIEFFTTKFEYWKMSPRKEMVASGERVYVLAEPGKQYIIYAAAGGTLALKLPFIEFEAWRYDPRTGEDSVIRRVRGPAPAEFRMPDDQDWVVYLRPVR